MNQGTKQRIVGTVVLLALALIFLPIVFDGEGSYQTPLASRIPEPPMITLLPEPAPNRPVILNNSEPVSPATSAAVAETAPAPAPEAQITPTPDADSGATAVDQAVAIVESEAVFTREVPSLDANGLPQGWSVRLGSFSEAANASALMTRLQAAGYRAYTRRLGSAGAELTAVYVGPWIERERVEDYKKQLQDEFQLSGLVVRYEVDKLID